MGVLSAAGTDLTLGSAVVNPGGNASLGLALTVSGTAPAGVQWGVSYLPAQISSLSITAGTATTAAGKTLSCSSGTGAATCLIAGLNATAIGTGNVATLNATLAPGVSSASIQIVRATGADAGAKRLTFTTVSGGTLNAPALLSLGCTPTALIAGAKSTCVVTLSQSAPAGGAVIGLTSNSGLLTAPASVAVAAGSTTANFTVTAAGTIPSNQNAVVSANFGGVSQTATLALTAAPAALVSSLTCSPASLAAGGASTCVVGLSSAAPAGGTSVTVTSNNGLLTVPGSVTIAAGASSGTFKATAGTAIPNNQNASVTATSGASSQSATIALTANAPGVLSGISCSPVRLGPGQTSSCTVSLKAAASGNGVAVSLQSNSSSLTVPGAVTVPSGSTGASFNAVAGAFSGTQAAVITAALNGVSATATLTLRNRTQSGAATSTATTMSAVKVQCAAGSVAPGGRSTCELTVPSNSSPMAVELASSSAQVHVPEVVVTRPSQTSLTFEAESDPSAGAGPVTLSATLGDSTTESTLQIMDNTADNAANAEAPPAATPCAKGEGHGMAVAQIRGKAVPMMACAGSGAGEIGLLSVTGQSQGLISFAGTRELAMQRNNRLDGYPAQPGDEIVISATGNDLSLDPSSMLLKISDVYVPVESVQPAADRQGIYELRVHVPAAMTFGEVPVQLQVLLPGGRQVVSNSVTAVFEAARD